MSRPPRHVACSVAAVSPSPSAFCVPTSAPGASVRAAPAAPASAPPPGFWPASPTAAGCAPTHCPSSPSTAASAAASAASASLELRTPRATSLERKTPIKPSNASASLFSPRYLHSPHAGPPKCQATPPRQPRPAAARGAVVGGRADSPAVDAGVEHAAPDAAQALAQAADVSSREGGQPFVQRGYLLDLRQCADGRSARMRSVRRGRHPQKNRTRAGLAAARGGRPRASTSTLNSFLRNGAGRWAGGAGRRPGGSWLRRRQAGPGAARAPVDARMLLQRQRQRTGLGARQHDRDATEQNRSHVPGPRAGRGGACSRRMSADGHAGGRTGHTCPCRPRTVRAASSKTRRRTFPPQSRCGAGSGRSGPRN